MYLVNIYVNFLFMLGYFCFGNGLKHFGNHASNRYFALFPDKQILKTLKTNHILFVHFELSKLLYVSCKYTIMNKTFSCTDEILFVYQKQELITYYILIRYILIFLFFQFNNFYSKYSKYNNHVYLKLI